MKQKTLSYAGMLIAAIVLLCTMLAFATPVHAETEITVEKPYLLKVIPSSKQIILSWNNTYVNVAGKVKKASGYELQYSTSSTFKSPVTKKYDEKQYRKTFDLPKKASSYYARVRAFYKASGKTTYSGWRTAADSVTMTQYTYPAITLKKGTGNSVTVSWEAVDGAEYIVYRYEDGAYKKIKTIKDSTVTKYVDGNRLYDTSYKYLVKTKKEIVTKNPPVINGSSLITDTSTAKSITLANPLTKPANMKISYADEKFTFECDPVKEAQKYVFTYATTSDFKDAKKVVTTTPKAEISAEDINTIYVRSHAKLYLTVDGEKYSYNSPKSDAVALSVPKYTVNFDGNSADSGSMDQVKTRASITFDLPQNAFVKDGYTFAGWNTAADGSGIAYKDGASVKDLRKTAGEITLYAQWESMPYTITYNKNAEDAEGSMSKQSLNKDEEEGLFANKFTRTGYTFNGWNTKEDGSGNAYTDGQTVNNLASPGKKITLYAQWDAIKYTIKFNGNSPTEGKTPAVSTKVGQKVTLPANQYEKEGYTFVGWSLVKNNEIDMMNYQLGTPDFLDEEEVMNLSMTGETVTLYACWKGSGPVAAADWALKIAKDDSFYYGLVATNGKLSKTDGHSHCWFCQGGLKAFNCNALCAAAYQHGTGYFKKFWTGNTKPDPWADRGFKKLGKNYDPAKIKKGDIICCYNGSRWSHVMMAASEDSVDLEDRKIVNARGWDKGICTQNMLTKLDNYKYYYVLRLQ